VRTETRIRPARGVIDGWRREGSRIALVPTMGNLHQGHLSLVEAARGRADRVVVTIFVNPLQFGPSEDFGAYPRTFGEDQAKLEGANVDLVFEPEPGEMYPRGDAQQCRVEVPSLSDILCGASRPGHFAGVATVVAKLFNIAGPDVALFGEKDFQQLLVIRRMTADLCFPIEIEGVATVREPDGLAMSSRNAYLSPVERAKAPFLYRTLCAGAEKIAAGSPWVEVEDFGRDALRYAGFETDYFAVRRAEDLLPPAEDDADLVLLAAARLGRARLIDNVRVDRGRGLPA
jgi:pantoate--beta-alanine ligase